MQREDIKMLVRKWWDIYNDKSLDYKPTAGADGEAEPVNVQTLSVPFSETGSIQHVTVPLAAQRRHAAFG